MFNFIRCRLSVRLSLLLSAVLLPALALVALAVIRNESVVVEDLVLKEAKTAALQGAAAYGAILSTAVDSGSLTLGEITDPVYEEMKFFTEDKQPLHLEDKRYHTRVGDYADAHGIKELQDATKQAGGFLFATGMHRRGLVLTGHSGVDLPPRGDATPESAAWDRAHSRQKRMFTGVEQLQAAGFLGNANAPTIVLPYPRDTGQMAWDVSAPIYVKGQHFGGFRVGVSRDLILRRNLSLTVDLALMFGAVGLVMVGFLLLVSWHHIRPLSALADRAEAISLGVEDVLSEQITTTDKTEVGRVTKAVNRLRLSLSVAMHRLDRKNL